MSCWSTVNGSYYCVVVLLNTPERPGMLFNAGRPQVFAKRATILITDNKQPVAPLTLVIERDKDVKG